MFAAETGQKKKISILKFLSYKFKSVTGCTVCTVHAYKVLDCEIKVAIILKMQLYPKYTIRGPDYNVTDTIS